MTLSSTNKRLLSNFFSLAILKGSMHILSLITLPYLIKILSAEKFGFVMFAQALIIFHNILINNYLNLIPEQLLKYNIKVKHA